MGSEPAASWTTAGSEAAAELDVVARDEFVSGIAIGDGAAYEDRGVVLLGVKFFHRRRELWLPGRDGGIWR